MARCSKMKTRLIPGNSGIAPLHATRYSSCNKVIVYDLEMVRGNLPLPNTHRKSDVHLGTSFENKHLKLLDGERMVSKKRCDRRGMGFEVSRQ